MDVTLYIPWWLSHDRPSFDSSFCQFISCASCLMKKTRHKRCIWLLTLESSIELSKNASIAHFRWLKIKKKNGPRYRVKKNYVCDREHYWHWWCCTLARFGCSWQAHKNLQSSFVQRKLRIAEPSRAVAVRCGVAREEKWEVGGWWCDNRRAYRRKKSEIRCYVLICGVSDAAAAAATASEAQSAHKANVIGEERLRCAKHSRTPSY